MIEVNELSFKYHRKEAMLFDTLSANFEDGNIYGLLGKNGAGKSTLLHLMSGLLTPMSGCVLVNNTDVRRREVCTLQELFLVPEEFELPAFSLKKYIRLNAPFYPKFSTQDMEETICMTMWTTEQ